MTDAASVPPEPPQPPGAAVVPAGGGAAGAEYKVRNPVAVVIFMFITLGIYGLYWTYHHLGGRGPGRVEPRLGGCAHTLIREGSAD